MRLITLLGAAALLSASLSARADIASDTFTGTFSSPNLNDPVVFNLPAFTGSTGGTVGTELSYQITDTQVILSDLGNTGLLSSPFTGFQFTDVSETPNITGFTSDPTLSTIMGGVGTISGNVLTFNLAGASVTPGTSAVFDITTAPPSTAVTPEPSSIALLGTGLLGFAGIVRRRLA